MAFTSICFLEECVISLVLSCYSKDYKQWTTVTTWKWSEVKWLNRVWLFATPWTVAYHAPMSMEFSRQEYWSGLPFPSPGEFPNPGIEPRSSALQADSLLPEPPGKSIFLTGCILQLEARLLSEVGSNIPSETGDGVSISLWLPFRGMVLRSWLKTDRGFQTMKRLSKGFKSQSGRRPIYN